MRRILYALFSTISAVVLLFSYHTSTEPQAAAAGGGQPVIVATASQNVATVPTSGTSRTEKTTATTSGSGGGTGTTSSTSAASTAKTYDGGVVQTRWGPVQVRITVTDGKITASDAIQYPSGDGHSSQISSYAVPMLNQQAVSAQSAQLDGVSGATYTTQGYEESLQSAIDAAGL